MLQFVVTVGPADVELASDLLWGLGVVAVEERSTDGEEIELWTSLGDEADAVPADFPWPWRTVEIDAGVADTWREFARPVEITPDLWVRPEWVGGEGIPDGATVISVEPGSTFGMGDHPTTVQCLRAVRRLVTPGMDVLDVGCGSGVLAVLAAMQGARAVGVDIAPASVPVTRHNSALNGVDVEVSTTPLEDVAGDYDVVLANILAPVLVGLAADLVRVVRPGGALVISGILADPDRHQHVLDALAELTVESIETLDGWAAITLRRSATR